MKKPIFILHGWGLYGQKYNSLQKIFEKNGYQVFAPDFPGFGKEPLKKPVMAIDDYVDFVVTLMNKKKIKKAYFIGHSFGGRVLAKLAALRPDLIEKIVFTGSPLIREKLSLKKNIVRLLVRKGKSIVAFTPAFFRDHLRWGIYRFIGEWDYYKASGMREIFKNVIHEDASMYLNKIQSSTLVLWGANDRIVPKEIGQQITTKIPKAHFEAIPDQGHGVLYTNPEVFAKKVLLFFSK